MKWEFLTMEERMTKEKKSIGRMDLEPFIVFLNTIYFPKSKNQQI
mgnify:CR=1 FL=1